MGHVSHWLHDHHLLPDLHHRDLSGFSESLKTAWMLILLVIWCLTVISIVSQFIYPDVARVVMNLFL